MSLFDKPIKITVKSIKDKPCPVYMFSGDTFTMFNKGDSKNPPIAIDMINNKEFVIYINPFKFPQWNKKTKQLEVKLNSKIGGLE